MDTGIWMQESFWESAGEQNAKNSAQESCEHSAAEYLTEGRNGDGGNKPVDQEASPWQYAYENILIGMGLCGIRLNFLLLYSSIYWNLDDIFRISKIETREQMV